MDADWRRLGAQVEQRRRELGLTQEDVRQRGGPSTATMRLIEGALQESYRPAILANLERALLWAPGSVDAVLGGGDPVERDAGVRYPTRGPQRREARESDRSTDPAVQEVIDSDLPWHEKEKLIDGLIEERLLEEQRRVAHARRYIELYRRTAGE